MKIADLKDKTVNDLNEMVVEFKKQLFDIRFKKFTNKYENATDLGRANSQLKEIRKSIAQVKTVINQKKSV